MTRLLLLCSLLLLLSLRANSQVYTILHFNTGKDDLRERDSAILDYIVREMQDSPHLGIQCEGHCDSLEFPVNNFLLSLRRAEAAKRYLVSKGFSPCRIKTIGLGATVPSLESPGDESIYRALNRRVEFRVFELEATNLTTSFLPDTSLLAGFEWDKPWLDGEGLKQLNLFRDVVPRLLQTDDSVKIEVTLDGEFYQEQCKRYFRGCFAVEPCDSLKDRSMQLCQLRRQFIEAYFRDLQLGRNRLLFIIRPLEAAIPTMPLRILRYKCF